MPVVRRVGVKKVPFGTKPVKARQMSSADIVRALAQSATTHEDRERVRMLERHLAGGKGRKVPRGKPEPLSHEQKESMGMIARFLAERKDGKKRKDTGTSQAHWERDGVPPF